MSEAHAASLFGLSGQTAIVTGGTRGIGHAVVEELAALGAQVAKIGLRGTSLSVTMTAWPEVGQVSLQAQRLCS